MKLAELARRLTGISTPVIGLSWQPQPSEREAARRAIVFLEDRRVLYEPSELEVPEHCVESVLRIREHLTGELGNLHDDSPLASNLRAILAACRKFLRTVDGHHPRLYAPGAYERWVFDSALGELRGVVGVHVALIAERYGIQVDADLSRILPEPAE